MTLVLDDLLPEAAARAQAALANGEPVTFQEEDQPGRLMIGLFRDDPELMAEIAREARKARDRETKASVD